MNERSGNVYENKRPILKTGQEALAKANEENCLKMFFRGNELSHLLQIKDLAFSEC